METFDYEHRDPNLDTPVTLCEMISVRSTLNATVTEGLNTTAIMDCVIVSLNN